MSPFSGSSTVGTYQFQYEDERLEGLQGTRVPKDKRSEQNIRSRENEIRTGVDLGKSDTGV